MNDSPFDPDTFMTTSTDGANSTVSEPVPSGDFNAVIDKVDVRPVETKNGQSYSMDVTWNILDDAVKSKLDRDKVTVRQSIWLDMTAQGQLDMGKGKNVGLGRLRSAVGQNDPGKPWAPGMLTGAGPALIKVGHRADKNSDQIFAEVKAVAKV